MPRADGIVNKERLGREVVEYYTVPGFVLIPKVEGVANPRIGRLGAGDEWVVFDVLLVETDVGLGDLGDLDVGAGQFLA